jgi:hypothetical protein
LGGAAKAMIVVNLCPTDLNFAGTMESLKFATTARGVKVDANTGAQSAAVALQIKNMESKVRRANAEVKETMTKYSLIESSYNETKKSAQELVQQMREHSTVIAARYAEEQEQNKLLAGTYVSLFSVLFSIFCMCGLANVLLMTGVFKMFSSSPHTPFFAAGCCLFVYLLLAWFCLQATLS